MTYFKRIWLCQTVWVQHSKGNYSGFKTQIQKENDLIFQSSIILKNQVQHHLETSRN